MRWPCPLPPLTIQEPRPLTTDEIRFFRFNGFLKLPWRLPPEVVARIEAQAAGDIEQAVEPLSRDYRGDVMRLSAVWERGGAIREALGGPEVVPALQSLLGPDVELMLNRQNHVTLRRRDDRTAMSIELHRDVRNWSRTICTILFFLEDTNLENGCTQIIPGSHLLPDVAPGLIAESDPWWIASGLLEQRISIPMPAGGLLGMALDVTTPEPLPADSPLRAMPNVIITPHLAGQGRYGHTRIGEATVHALEVFLPGGR